MLSFCIQYAQAQAWQSLFNNKDLTGWHTIPGGKWAVAEGISIGASEKSDVRHGLLVTDISYSNFIVNVT